MANVKNESINKGKSYAVRMDGSKRRKTSICGY